MTIGLVAMLLGSPVEAPFGDDEAGRIIGATRTLQFEPGTRYSYVNQNFRLLAEISQERNGRSFAELLRDRIFERAGMHSAFLAADTSAMPDGATGYEGSVAGGFRAAKNHIIWTGDAGLGASLDDMIAWEKYIDTTRDDADALYRRLSAPVTFADGTPSPYGFGLNRATSFGHKMTGHGGALRGWRSHRLYVPSERISVVVMFNHLADAQGAAMDLLASALGHENPRSDAVIPLPEWMGAYIEPETGLAVRIDPGTMGRVRLRYANFSEQLDRLADGSACTDEGTRLVPGEDGLWMHRPRENLSACLSPLDAKPMTDIAGQYHCDEIDAGLTVVDTGGVLYGGFSGFLGQGRMELLELVAANVWALPCPRALDHTPPGDWTLRFENDSAERVTGVRVGCWLARGLSYRRVG